MTWRCGRGVGVFAEQVIRMPMLRCRIRSALAAEGCLDVSRHSCVDLKRGKIVAAIWRNILVKMA